MAATLMSIHENDVIILLLAGYHIVSKILLCYSLFSNSTYLPQFNLTLLGFSRYK